MLSMVLNAVCYPATGAPSSCLNLPDFDIYDGDVIEVQPEML